MSSIKLIITFLNLPRLLPAILLLLFFIDDCKLDIAVNKKHHLCRLPLIGAFCYLMVFDKWFRNLFYYRIGKYKYFISFLAPPAPSFFIGTYAKIGKGFLVIHPYSTYVNVKSVGNNFTIRNNVTIGNNKGGVPVIGNNVTINVHSVVVGNIVIGDNVVIGAGTVLMKSVPSNCVVVGNPASILRRNGVLVNEKL